MGPQNTPIATSLGSEARMLKHATSVSGQRGPRPGSYAALSRRWRAHVEVAHNLLELGDVASQELPLPPDLLHLLHRHLHRKTDMPEQGAAEAVMQS